MFWFARDWPLHSLKCQACLEEEVSPRVFMAIIGGHHSSFHLMRSWSGEVRRTTEASGCILEKPEACMWNASVQDWRVQATASNGSRMLLRMMLGGMECELVVWDVRLCGRG